MVGKSVRYTSKSSLKKAIKKKLVLVDEKPGTTATFISGGEQITIYSDEQKGSAKNFVSPLEVIYEDNFLAVINKPAGILVSGNTFKTIDNALVQNLKSSAAPDVCRPRPVHRLDYPTTGLLLIGKTKQSIITLNQLFENKKINKSYLAITVGKMNSEGFIDDLVDGKVSKSNYTKVRSVASERFGSLNLLLLKPETGRKHQLRKHLAGIGNEVLGEQQYGNPDFLLKGKGLYLHAFKLEFTHPILNTHLSFQTSIPAKFIKIMGSDLRLQT